MLEPAIMRPSTREPARKLNGENFISKVISPAICGETCPICLRELEDRTAAVLTTCIHAYCIGCIRKWSNLKRTCPLCNAQFDSWFAKINLSSRSFRKERLATSDCPDKLKVGVGSSRTDARGCVFCFWYVFMAVDFVLRVVPFLLEVMFEVNMERCFICYFHVLENWML